MQNIASRYSKALLQLAIEEGALNRIQQDVHLLSMQYAANKSLFDALQHPLVKRHKKQEVLEMLLGDLVHPLVLRFFALIVKKRRLALLPSVLRQFLVQCERIQGVTRAQVKTGFPLSERLADRLKVAIQAIVPSKEILLEHTIDSALVGGYVLQVGDRQLDRSVRSRLNIFKNRYVTEGY